MADITVQLTEYDLEPVLGEFKDEAALCKRLCEIFAPEYSEKLFAWFSSQPEEITFGKWDRPSPLLKREGNILHCSLGVKIGEERFTELPKFERRRYTINLEEL